MIGAGIHLPPFALPVDEPTPADDGTATVGCVPDPGVNEPEALPGGDVEGLRVVSCSVDHASMLSLGPEGGPWVVFYLRAS